MSTSGLLAVLALPPSGMWGLYWGACLPPDSQGTGNIFQTAVMSHRTKHFHLLDWIYSQDSSLRWILSIPFHSFENQETNFKRINVLPSVVQLGDDSLEIHIQVLSPGSSPQVSPSGPEPLGCPFKFFILLA